MFYAGCCDVDFLRVLCTFVVNRICIYCMAVASAEQSAASVTFRRPSAKFPPTQNVISAALAELTARKFGGKFAKSATKESFRATFAQIANFAHIYLS